MKKLCVIATMLVLALCQPAVAEWEAKVTFGDELNLHAGFRPFPSQHFSVGLALAAVRESPTNDRQVGIDDWRVGAYLEMAALDLSSVWPQLPVLGKGHAGLELMYDLHDREDDAELQMVPYVGLCAGLPDYPSAWLVTDARWYENRRDLVVSIGPLFVFK